MRVYLRDFKVVEAADIYIKNVYSDRNSTPTAVPKSVDVYITYYDHFSKNYNSLKIGSFSVNEDRDTYAEVMKKYKEMILLPMLRNGYCEFNFLGKYWTGYCV